MRPSSHPNFSLGSRISRPALSPKSRSGLCQVFDRNAKRIQKDRAVSRTDGRSNFSDYLKDEVAGRLIERFLVSMYPAFYVYSLIRSGYQTSL